MPISHHFRVAAAIAGLAAIAAPGLTPGTSAEEVRQPTIVPKIKDCSSSRKAKLTNAWKQAHSMVWQAKVFVARIKAWPAHERAQLWSRDHVDANYSVSPRTWFGGFSNDRLDKVLKALEKAERRFRRKGNVKIRRMHCGGVFDGTDRDVDRCPAAGLLSPSTVAAYHFPPGTIRVCDVFWNSFGNQFVEPWQKEAFASEQLIHEVFHWLSVDGKYITDYHGDGAGGIRDKKYDTPSLARELARRDARRATRNVDSYSNFAANVGLRLPHATAIWRNDSQGSRGKTTYALAMNWDNLLTYRDLRKNNMTLMDVETYVWHGERKFTGLWHKDSGRTGALWLKNSRSDFIREWEKLKDTQDLIDIEIYKVGANLKFLGVWRKKKAATRNRPGALYWDMSWDGLTRRWSQTMGADKQLVDIESYVDIDGVRKFAGVWVPKANPRNEHRGALYGVPGAIQFDTLRRDLQSGYRLEDFERYFHDGHEAFIGVWRKTRRSGDIFHYRMLAPVEQEIARRKHNAWLMDIDYDLDLPQRLPR